MKYLSEYRDIKQVKQYADLIAKISRKPITIMEVCGSHTNSIHRFGIKQLLPQQIRLISGPGCPVCVTGMEYIDKAIALARIPNVIIATYGDLIKVPGSTSTLEKEKFKGATIEMVYSIREAIGLSERHPDKKVVFLAIGFETTTPPTAAGVIEAKNKGLKNFFVLVSHKVMPPAMKAIIDDEINVDAFLAPGHVSVITGSSIYDFISRDYKKPVVISGFEPLDIMQSIYEIVRQSEENKAEVHIQYSRVVKPEGNTIAQTITDEVFEPTDANWRGLGILKNSALKFNEAFSSFDAEQAFQLSVETPDEPKGCMCGYILKGLNNPNQCPLFARTCTPDNPVGACMVSPEGACNVYYRYDR